MDSDKFVIVIGRQYGSLGRVIGKALAERLDISFYDRKLLSQAAEKYGFLPSVFEKADEKKPSILHSMIQYAYGNPSIQCCGDNLSDENIYEKQSSVIKAIAQEESCVIVGRTADYVLRHHPCMVSVFLHAPVDKRADEIIRRGDAQSHNAAVSLAAKVDKSRKSYYDYYTGRHWGQADNYHLSFDTSILSTDQIISLISAYLECRKTVRNSTFSTSVK